MNPAHGREHVERVVVGFCINQDGCLFAERFDLGDSFITGDDFHARITAGELFKVGPALVNPFARGGFFGVGPDPVLARLVENVLGGSSHDVASFADGPGAVAAAYSGVSRQCCFDVVIISNHAFSVNCL